jgi:hypothetical protein
MSLAVRVPARRQSVTATVTVGVRFATRSPSQAGGRPTVSVTVTVTVCYAAVAAAVTGPDSDSDDCCTTRSGSGSIAGRVGGAAIRVGRLPRPFRSRARLGLPRVGFIRITVTQPRAESSRSSAAPARALGWWWQPRGGRAGRASGSRPSPCFLLQWHRDWHGSAPPGRRRRRDRSLTKSLQAGRPGQTRRTPGA